MNDYLCPSGFSVCVLHRSLQIEELHQGELKLSQGKISLHGLSQTHRD